VETTIPGPEAPSQPLHTRPGPGIASRTKTESDTEDKPYIWGSQADVFRGYRAVKARLIPSATSSPPTIWR